MPESCRQLLFKSKFRKRNAGQRDNMSLISYNKDIENPPEYLNKDFFEEVLENALQRTDFGLQHVQFTMGSSVGENYCSLIYRVRVEYYDNSDPDLIHGLSLIIKSMPISTANDFLLDFAVFLKEKTTYYRLLPRMEMFLKKGQRFGARLYHHLRVPVHTLVFEDLKQLDYEMADREKGLDLQHAALVLRRLGEFHATSMVLAKKDPAIMQSYNAGMLAEHAIQRESSILPRFFGTNFDGLLEITSQWPDYADIHKKLQKYRQNLETELIKAQALHPNEIKVLNHGDLWVNNILFKYNDTQEPSDVVFVDYQLSIWSSPGIDLNYFFHTSLQQDVLETKREELISIYYKSLCSMLQQLSYDNIPTFAEIRAEVRQRESYGFFANFAIFPLMCMDKETSSDASVDNFDDPEFARQKTKKMFASKRLQENMKYTLKRFDALGIWDDE